MSKTLTGYQLFTREFVSGKKGLSGATNLRAVADVWNSLSDFDKQDYAIRAKSVKAGKAKKSPKKQKSMPGATKRMLFKEEFMTRYPGSTAEDAYTLWNSLSQSDRNAYIGIISQQGSGGYWNGEEITCNAPYYEPLRGYPPCRQDDIYYEDKKERFGCCGPDVYSTKKF
jgi:hypothetical protein